MVVLLLALFWIYYFYYKPKKEYEKTSYFAETQIPYVEMRRNKGKRGEYLIFDELQGLEERGAKFLFNLYVPKADGVTAEIDAVCISDRGVFVFESKNFGGWIFGNENQKLWTQTLTGRYVGVEKNRFYNPIWQNRSHINSVRSYLRLENNFPLFSVVTFSDRCEFRDVSVTSKEVYVVQVYELKAVVNDVYSKYKRILREEDINYLYDCLRPLGKTAEDVRNRHNEVVRKYKV